MKTLLTLLLLIPSLSFGEKKTFTTEELFGDSEKILTFEDAKELENQEKEYNNNRKLWIADCYLKARKDSEIKSDNDAIFVNKHCTTLGYDKYPEKEFFIIPKKE